MNIKQLKSDAISNLKEIASDLGHAPSRDEYLFNEKKILNQRKINALFSSYSDFLVAAGLSEARKAQTDKNNKVSQQEKNQAERKKLFDFYSEQVFPYGEKFLKTNKKDTQIIVGAQDFHFPYEDKFCVSVFIDVCKRLQPDIIALSETVDFYDISRFDKDPSRMKRLQDEIDQVYENLLKPLREACPNSQIDMVQSNHDARLIKYLCTQAQGLASLRCLRFPALLRLDELEINFIARKSVINGDETKNNYKTYFDDKFIWTHGHYCSTYHSGQELAKWGRSGASGHVHHSQHQSKVILDRELFWYSLGCMCIKNADFDKDLNRWNQSFLIVSKIGNEIIPNEIMFTDKSCLALGRLYKREKAV